LAAQLGFAAQSAFAAQLGFAAQSAFAAQLGFAQQPGSFAAQLAFAAQLLAVQPLSARPHLRQLWAFAAQPPAQSPLPQLRQASG
jgi:hypothetical protein